MKAGTIDLIETAYRTDVDTTTWLRDLAVTMPRPPRSHGVVSYLYRLTLEGRVEIDDVAEIDVPTSLLSVTKSAVAAMPPDYVRQTWATVPATMALQTGDEATRTQTRAALHGLYGHVGIKDILVLNGIDPTGAGVYIGALTGEEASLTRREQTTWSRVASHLAAAYRLRRAQPSEPEAILSARGRIEHAIDAATTRDARESLRDAALAIDRARTNRWRAHDAEAVEMWHALVAGRWTLIDRVDNDGRRYFIARKNDPEVARHHALTRRELQVVGYAVLGHSNKLIAYEMGLSVSTVAGYLASASDKLGVGARTALIQAAQAFGAPAAPTPSAIGSGPTTRPDDEP